MARFRQPKRVNGKFRENLREKWRMTSEITKNGEKWPFKKEVYAKFLGEKWPFKNKKQAQAKA